MICLGCALCHQVALMQEQHVVGDLLHDTGIVLDDEQRLALGLQAPQQRHDRIECAGGEAGCGFVEQQQFGAGCEHACDRQ